MSLSPEPVHILSRRDADYSQECSPHNIRSPKTAGVCNLLQTHIGTVDHLLCRLNPQSIDKLPGVHVGFPEAHTCEMPGTHADPGR